MTLAMVLLENIAVRVAAQARAVVVLLLHVARYVGTLAERLVHVAAQASLTLLVLPILTDLAVRRAPPKLGEYLGAIGGLLPAPVRDVLGQQTVITMIAASLLVSVIVPFILDLVDELYRVRALRRARREAKRAAAGRAHGRLKQMNSALNLQQSALLKMKRE